MIIPYLRDIRGEGGRGGGGGGVGCSETNNFIKELFKSFLNNYQKEEQIIRGSNFVFESEWIINFIKQV